MSQARIDICMKAFDKLDSNSNGIVEMSEFKAKYDVSRHPDVQSGKKTPEEALFEFIETFEIHHNTRNGAKADGKITREEFIEYYNNISCSIDNDNYFTLMMNNAWNLDGRADVRTMAFAGGKNKVIEISSREAWK